MGDGRRSKAPGFAREHKTPMFRPAPLKITSPAKEEVIFCSYSVKKALQHHQQGAGTDQQAADGRFGRDLLVQEHCGQNQRDHDA